MRKIFTLFILLLCLKNSKAQYVTIPNANFVAWLQANVPAAMSGNQMDTTKLAVTTRTNINVCNAGINDLSGVQYFDSLQYLNCSFNQLSSIPILANRLLELNCIQNLLNSLPVLPTSLKSLSCQANSLISLPILPLGLNYLDCAGTQLTSLPTLPLGLNYLDCEGNQLTSLPTLPLSLNNLRCGLNQLISLPTLPNSLTSLACANNQITSLPTLPNALTYLRCSHNQITSLPFLPTTLTAFYCSYNNIYCFAPFIFNNMPAGYFAINNNQITCLPNYISAMNATALAYPLCTPGNSNGCANREGIIGSIYKDNDNNCAKSAGDIGLKNIKLKLYDNVNNLLSQTYSNYDDLYAFYIPTANTYTVIVDTVGVPFTTSCIYPGFDSTLFVNQLDTNINFVLNCKPGFDLGIQSINRSGIVFPGQLHTLNINAGDINHWYNLNCTPGISGTVSFSVTGPVNYIGPAVGSLTPSVAGNIYTYNISDFGIINNATDFKLLFQTKTIAQAGNKICITAVITPTIGDNNPGNNTFTYCYPVVNSYDPNIKEVYPVDVQPGFNDWLTYSIHFQNTGNAPAYNIRLLDTLDNMLDLETFQVINYSHQNAVDLNGNILNVRFPNIMLPDSTSNFAGSIGYVQYRIKPKATWVSPYKIKNTAYIYFDYNTPIVTNTTYNSILIPTGLNSQTETVMALYPNPTNGTFTIELNNKQKQSIQVFDITGNIVLSQNIENGKATIDANHFAAGIYNVSIKGNGSVTNKKLVIVK